MHRANTTDRATNALQFILPFVPASKKNRTRIHYRHGRAAVGLDKTVVRHEKAIQQMLALALAKAKKPVFGDDDVRVDMTWRVLAGVVDVTITRLCAKPSGRTGRNRDVTNIPALVLDALQGFAYANDSQVAELRVRREIS